MESQSFGLTRQDSLRTGLLALMLFGCVSPGTHVGVGAPDAGVADAGIIGGTDAGTTDWCAPDAGATVELAAFVNELTRATCSWEVRCGWMPDMPLCIAYYTRAPTYVPFGSPAAAVIAVDAGEASFDPTEAAACLCATAAASCDSTTEPTACADTFYGGTTPDGGACWVDAQCSAGTDCLLHWGPACGGTCTPLSPTNCNAETNEPCQSDQVCLVKGSPTGPTTHCVDAPAPAAVGQPCGDPQACAAGLICDETHTPNTCVMPAAAGAPCASTYYCASGLSCQGSPLTCTPLPGSGQTCDEEIGCAPGLACIQSDDLSTWTCLTPGAAGDPCVAQGQCGVQYQASDLICDEADTHTCVLAPSSGPCAYPDAQGFGACNTATSYCSVTAGVGTCQPYIPLGGACYVDANATIDVTECGFQGSCSGPEGGTGACYGYGAPPPCPIGTPAE